MAQRASLEASRSVPDHQKSKRRLTEKTVAFCSPPCYKMFLPEFATRRMSRWLTLREFRGGDWVMGRFRYFLQDLRHGIRRRQEYQDADLIVRMTSLAGRWKDQDSEFRQFITQRFDAVKLLGAGNASLLFAAGAFLTTAHRAGLAVMLGKVCLSVLALGVLAFARAFMALFRFMVQLEHVLYIVRGLEGTFIHNEDQKSAIKTGVQQYNKSNRSTYYMMVCFSVGCFIALITMIVS
jgi:hypothetical protein